MKKPFLWAGLLFIGMWGMVTFQHIRLELNSLMALPSLWEMNYDAKKRLQEGSVYGMLKRADDVIPGSPTQKVYLVGPQMPRFRDFIYYKTVYRLYPREIHYVDVDRGRPDEMPDGSYVILIIPRITPQGDAVRVYEYWMSMTNHFKENRIDQVRDKDLFALIRKVEYVK